MAQAATAARVFLQASPEPLSITAAAVAVARHSLTTRQALVGWVVAAMVVAETPLRLRAQMAWAAVAVVETTLEAVETAQTVAMAWLFCVGRFKE